LNLSEKIINLMFPKNCKPVKNPLGVLTGIFCLCFLFTVIGTIFGYHWGTGIWPFTESQVILPPATSNMTTAADVNTFLASDNTSDYEYKEGFNCAESALMASRNAVWQGIPAGVCKLNFQSGIGHMMLIFPTVDAGWVFVEPQSQSVVHPIIGGVYFGERVTGIDILQLSWIPLEVASDVK
jgi:hypothetical protein